MNYTFFIFLIHNLIFSIFQNKKPLEIILNPFNAGFEKLYKVCLTKDYSQNDKILRANIITLFKITYYVFPKKQTQYPSL